MQDKARTNGKLSPQQLALLDALTALAQQAVTSAPPAPVTWSAEWSCGACGDGGDAQFEDGTSVAADHDCGQGDGPEIGWEGRAECSAGGWSLDTDFADGEYVESDHHCATGQ